MRDDELEDTPPDANVCSRCGMARAEWTADQGHGLMQDDQIFCCEGCAQDTGCTCAEDRSELEDRPAPVDEEALPRKRRSSSAVHRSL